MKKPLKIIGISVAVLVAFLVLSLLVAKIFFNKEATSYLRGIQKEQYAELLTKSKFSADTLTLNPTYCMEDARLAEVKSHFRLDTLFDGTETTYQKALKIQRFVSDTLPHGNPPVMPKRLNAISLFAFADSTDQHLNCRHHSILMRDMLLSVGIKARYITCLPYDQDDEDCHVVNEVFLPELGKWAIIDADMDKVLTDMDGVPLSLWELREKLLSGDKYLINGEINDGQYYDTYMTKNSYWYSRHEMSCMDDETDGLLPGDRRIALIPEGHRVERGGAEWHFKNSTHTTNPDEFWK